MFSRFTPILLKAAATCFFFASFSASATNNTIVIGQAVDLSGPNGSLGRDYVAGIKTYFDMVNSVGGIQGKSIRYIVRDDQGQPEVSARAVSDLIERDHVDYLFGGVGDDVTRAVLDAPTFKRSDHILFAPLTTTEHPKDTRILFWRPSYKQELQHIFSHFSKLGINEVAVAYQDTPANQQAYRNLSATIQERRMKLTGTARIDAQGNQVAQEATRLAASRPGFVLVIADTIGTALFLKAYRKHDAHTFVASTSLINLATLRELAGSRAVEWTVFSQVVPDPSAGRSSLQIEHLDMMKKYRDEAVSSLTLEGFAAAKALVKAIQQSKRGSRSALQEFISQKSQIDLGGLVMRASSDNNHLSNYLDMALLRKGSGLTF